MAQYKMPMLVLVNSDEHGTRQLVGVNLINGRLARLVNDRAGTPLPAADLLMDNGKHPQPLDVIEVDGAEHLKITFGPQTENLVFLIPRKINYAQTIGLDNLSRILRNRRIGGIGGMMALRAHYGVIDETGPYLEPNKVKANKIKYSISIVKAKNLHIYPHDDQWLVDFDSLTGATSHESGFIITDPAYCGTERTLPTATMIMTVERTGWDSDTNQPSPDAPYAKNIAKIFEI